MALSTNNAVPASQTRLVDKAGVMTPPWLSFFTRLLSQPGTIEDVVLTGSSVPFTAPANGTLFISGGSVSSITVTRSGTTVDTGITMGAVPVSNGDVVTVSYSVLPTINFVPG